MGEVALNLRKASTEVRSILLIIISLASSLPVPAAWICYVRLFAAATREQRSWRPGPGPEFSLFYPRSTPRLRQLLAEGLPEDGMS